jgi:SAM-dependent methyltransferase
LHASAYTFVASVAPETPGAVLEIGAYDVNGGVRPLFAHATLYHGIDIRPGPGVDEAIGCADYDGEQLFDLVVSTETMEHMHDPSELIACAHRALRAGGLLILTCAGPKRAAHGMDGGAVGGEFYANITPEQLETALDGWEDIQIIHNAVDHDLYATARKGP